MAGKGGRAAAPTRLGEINYVDVIAHSCTVLGGVVRTEHGKGLTLAHGHLSVHQSSQLIVSILQLIVSLQLSCAGGS